MKGIPSKGTAYAKALRWEQAWHVYGKSKLTTRIRRKVGEKPEGVARSQM